MSQMNSKTDRVRKDRGLAMYVYGFVWSLFLTVGAYFVVQVHLRSNHTVPTDNVVILLLVLMALVQLAVQLFYFLHLGEEAKPRHRLMALGFAVGVVAILIFGSLWIMNNLNYHMASPDSTNSAIVHDEGISK